MNWSTRKKRSFRGRRAEVRMRRLRVVRTGVLGIAAVLALAGVWFGARADALTITRVVVSGGKTIDPTEVERKAEAALEGSYALLVPKRFSYTYPRAHVAAAVEALPRVRDATVERISRTDLSITVREYLPHALWCSMVEQDASSGCIFVSAEGYAYREAPLLEGTTFLRYVTEARTPEVGTQFADASYVRLTEEFARALRSEHGMHVYAVIETTSGDVRYQVRGGGELLVDRRADVQEVFENLESILTSEDFDHLEPGNFAYIDLRFGNKVYVKERALAAEETPETAAAMKAPDDTQSATALMAIELAATSTAPTATSTEEGGEGE